MFSQDEHSSSSFTPSLDSLIVQDVPLKLSVKIGESLDLFHVCMGLLVLNV